MSALPPDPDLDQLRRQAKDLLRAAQAGDRTARARIAAVSPRVALGSAQLALARGYGFASWVRMKAEVTRREILDERDAGRLAALLTEDPALATDPMRQWGDHPLGASPLGYVAMLRFDTGRHRWRDVSGTGALAQALLTAGAPVDGDPQDAETPLITAASYGAVEVAEALIAAGADLEGTASPRSGGVPGGTALLHAAVFGMTPVVDLLVAAGASVPDLVQGAAAGDITRWPPADADPTDRLLALVMAADHQRLDVIDQLVAAGTPVDAADPVWGRHPLQLAARNGRPLSVRRLIERGADPGRLDDQGRTLLQLSREGRRDYPTHPGHAAVQAILDPASAEA